MPVFDLSPSLNLTLDTNQCTDFLTHWSAITPGDPATLIAIQPKENDEHRPRYEFAYLSTQGEVNDFLTRNHDRKWNIYFTPYTAAPDLRTTPKKHEIAGFLTQHLDLDLPKPPHPHAAPTLDNYQRLYDKFAAVMPRQTALVFSGGGFQSFWRYPETLDPGTPNPTGSPWADRIETVNKAIEAAMGGDNCHNVNRILRLPGTVNWPDFKKRLRGREPAKAFVLLYPDTDWSRTWSFDNPVPRLSTPPEEATLDSDHDPIDPTAGAFTFADLSSRLQRIIRQGDPAPWENDRSKMVFYVVTQLCRRGWPDEAILPFLLEQTYALSNHVRAQAEPRAYALRQINRARETVRADWDRDQIGKLHPRSQANVRRALDEMGARFSFDTFSLKAYVNGFGPLRRIDDDASIDLRLAVDLRFGFLADKELFQDVTRHLCRTGDFHPVRSYLDSLTWDGIARIGYPASYDLPPDLVPVEPDRGTPSWLCTYGGADDNAYVRMVGRLTLLAAVRRIRDPGAKFDELLVLVNPQQGTDKSTALHVLAKNIEWFSDNLPFGAQPKVIIERLAGKWIVEASDLTGMRRADIDEMKQFLSSQVDEDRLAYDRYRTELPRQWVAIGTTNSEVFLTDSQNRRFWPVRVDRFDIAALRQDVDQLWAEAQYYERQNESIRLPEHYWGMAAEVQSAARSNEPWADEIQECIGDINGRLVNTDAWKILDKPPYQRTQHDNRRLGEAMRDLGFERIRARVDGQVRIVYARGSDDERQHTIFIFRDPNVRGPATASLEPTPGYRDPATQAPASSDDVPF